MAVNADSGPAAVASSEIEPYADHLAQGLARRSFNTKGDRTRYRLKIAAARALEETGYQDLRVAEI